MNKATPRAWYGFRIFCLMVACVMMLSCTRWVDVRNDQLPRRARVYKHLRVRLLPQFSLSRRLTSLYTYDRVVEFQLRDAAVEGSMLTGYFVRFRTRRGRWIRARGELVRIGLRRIENTQQGKADTTKTVVAIVAIAAGTVGLLAAFIALTAL